MPRLPEGTRVSSRDHKKRQGTFALETNHPLTGLFVVTVTNQAYIGQYADYGDFLTFNGDTDFNPNEY